MLFDWTTNSQNIHRTHIFSVHVCVKYFFRILLIPCCSILAVDQPPSIIQEPPALTFLYKDAVVKLPCVASGNPKPEYMWYKDGVQFNWGIEPRRITSWPGEGTLQFTSPTSHDAGIYQCVAFSSLGRSFSVTSRLIEAKIHSFPQLEKTLSLPFGSNITLKCEVPFSAPPAVVQWVTKSNSKMNFIEEDNRRALDMDGNLIIAMVSKSDNNVVYMCTANNVILRTMRTGFDTTILVRDADTPPPSSPASVIYSSPQRQTAIFNSTLRLKCIFGGNPLPDIRWSRLDVRTLILKDEPNISIRNGGTELEVRPVTMETRGTYQCTGANHISPRGQSVTFNIAVESKPMFSHKPEDTTVPLNGSHTFRCVAVGHPTPVVHWTINGKDPKEYLDGTRKWQKDSIMYLTNLIPSDAAVFQCNASNIHGYAFADAFLGIMREPPEFLHPPQSRLRVAEGGSVNITCRTFSAPPADIVWTRNGKETRIRNSNRYTLQANGDLLIKNLLMTDSGSYQCSASNPFGTRKSSGQLLVRRRTRIISPPLSTRVSENTQVRLVCRADTDPLELTNLEVTWSKDDRILPVVLLRTGSSFSTSGNGGGQGAGRYGMTRGDTSLLVNAVRPGDTGIYACNASNGLDFAVATAKLTVQGRPSPPMDANVDCSGSRGGAKTALVSWQPGADNNAPILEYLVEYSTQYEREFWHSADVVTSSSPHSTQDRPDSVVSMNSIGSARGLVSPQSIVRLRPYIAYQFRVRAKNQVGVSEASSSTTTTCQLDAEPPSTNPTQLTIYGTKPHNLIVRWMTLPYIEHNGPGLSYVVTVQCIDCANIPREKVNKTLITDYRKDRIEYFVFRVGLEVYTIETYKLFKVSIQARNQEGLSSQPVHFAEGHSGEDVPDLRPGPLTALEVGADQARLRWTLLDRESLLRVKGFFRGYRIEWCRATLPTEQCDRHKTYQDETIQKPSGMDIELGRKRRSLSPERTPRRQHQRRVRSSSLVPWSQPYQTTLKGLPGLARIKVWIRIINIQYAGPASDAIEIQTAEGVPGEVAEFTLVMAGVNHVELAWAKPMQENGRLTGYQLGYRELHGLDQGQLVQLPPLVDPEQLRNRIDGLKPHTNYRIYIWPRTRMGNGAETILDIETAPADQAPSRPTFVIQSIGERSLNISFKASQSLVSQPPQTLPGNMLRWPGTAFYIQYRLPGATTWEETQRETQRRWINVTGLQPDTTYYVRVVATSAVTHTSVSDTIQVSTGGSGTASALRGAGATWFILLVLLTLALTIVIIALCFWRRRRLNYTRGKPVATSDPMGDYPTSALQLYNGSSGMNMDPSMTTYLPGSTLGPQNKTCAIGMMSYSRSPTPGDNQKILSDKDGNPYDPNSSGPTKRRSLLVSPAHNHNGSKPCPPAYATLPTHQQTENTNMYSAATLPHPHHAVNHYNIRHTPSNTNNTNFVANHNISCHSPPPISMANNNCAAISAGTLLNRSDSIRSSGGGRHNLLMTNPNQHFSSLTSTFNQSNCSSGIAMTANHVNNSSVPTATTTSTFI